MKLPASTSFSEIEIHRPPGFEVRPDLKPANSTQHNTNTGRDFRGHPRSQALRPGEQRDITTRPTTDLVDPISHATLAPLGLSHRPRLSSVWTA
jgi:hypothetical protein